jgi:hypothetical protein
MSAQDQAREAQNPPCRRPGGRIRRSRCHRRYSDQTDHAHTTRLYFARRFPLWLLFIQPRRKLSDVPALSLDHRGLAVSKPLLVTSPRDCLTGGVKAAILHMMDPQVVLQKSRSRELARTRKAERR